MDDTKLYEIEYNIDTHIIICMYYQLDNIDMDRKIYATFNERDMFKIQLNFTSIESF